MAGTKFKIDYATAVFDQLRAIDRKHHGLIKRTIERRLRLEPASKTRNQRPLRGPTVLGHEVWQLRFGPGSRFRAFYELHPEQEKVVVLAVGEKRGNRLWVGGKEIIL